MESRLKECIRGFLLKIVKGNQCLQSCLGCFPVSHEVTQEAEYQAFELLTEKC